MEDANRCCAVHLATTQRRKGPQVAGVNAEAHRGEGPPEASWAAGGAMIVALMCHRKAPQASRAGDGWECKVPHHKGVIYNEVNPAHQGSQGTVMISDESREPGRVPSQGEGHLSWVLARGCSTPTPSHRPPRPFLPQSPGSSLYGLPVSFSLGPGMSSFKAWCGVTRIWMVFTCSSSWWVYREDLTLHLLIRTNYAKITRKPCLIDDIQRWEFLEHQ